MKMKSPIINDLFNVTSLAPLDHSMGECVRYCSKPAVTLKQKNNLEGKKQRLVIESLP